MVAALLSTLSAGIFAPAVANYLHRVFTSHQFYVSLLLLGTLQTPPAFPGTHFFDVNGSLWTIPYEFRCYLLVAFAGLCGILRRPALWLTLTGLLFVFFLFPALTGPPEEWHRIYFLTGQPNQIARLFSIFCIGACFHLFRRRIPFRPVLAIVSLVALIAVGVFAPFYIERAVITFGAYLLFYFGQMPAITLDWMKRIPDISYGVYLYGGPIESFWIFYHRTASPWLTFLAATVLSYLAGWLSWHLVERPMLTLKRRPAAPLPPP